MSDTTFSLPTGDMFPATLEFVDSFGNPAVAPTGVTPAWAVDNATILTIAPAGDGMSANISTVGPIGTANVSVTDGTITGTLAVTVTAGPVASITIVPGTAVA